jgi:hypothetical protein
MAAELRQLGLQNGKRPFTPVEFDADPKWAELVAATLDGAA